MKKIMATLLSMVMLFATAVPAFAEVYEPSPGVVSVAGENGTVNEIASGLTYYFDLQIERDGRIYDYDEDEYRNYSVSVAKRGNYPSYCDVARVVRRSDGTYDLMVSARSRRNQYVDFDIELTTKTRRSPYYTDVSTTYFQVDDNYEYLYYGDIYADNYTPFVEFDSSVRNVNIDFGGVATYRGNLTYSYRSHNLYYNTEPDYYIQDQNRNAYLMFIDFVGRPDFGTPGYLEFNTQDKYVYEITDSGLVKMDSSRTNTGETRIRTRMLTKYVVSDRALNNVIGDQNIEDPNGPVDPSNIPIPSNTPTPENPPATQGKLPLTTSVINTARREGNYGVVTFDNDGMYTSGAELSYAGNVLKYGEKLILRRINSGTIPYQWYINAKKANTVVAPFKLGITQNYTSTKNFFEKWFNNNVATIHFEHTGKIGMNVDVAVRADLGTLNKATLRAYHYDQTTNKYKALPNAAPYVDSSGYVHMTINEGGDVIITDKVLMFK